MLHLLPFPSLLLSGLAIFLSFIGFGVSVLRLLSPPHLLLILCCYSFPLSPSSGSYGSHISTESPDSTSSSSTTSGSLARPPSPGTRKIGTASFSFPSLIHVVRFPVCSLLLAAAVADVCMEGFSESGTRHSVSGHHMAQVGLAAAIRRK